MKHVCHAVGCGAEVPPKMLFCLAHWKLLPKPAQRIIWHYYVPGQEDRKDPTELYCLAQSCAVAIVAFKSKAWGALTALNHVARASAEAQRSGVSLQRTEEIILAMGCEILAR